MFSHESTEVQFVMFTDCRKHASAGPLINLLDFYTSKTEQYLEKLAYWALMKPQVLITIQA